LLFPPSEFSSLRRWAALYPFIQGFNMQLRTLPPLIAAIFCTHAHADDDNVIPQ
jgi:hypothetical protein